MENTDVGKHVKERTKTLTQRKPDRKVVYHHSHLRRNPLWGGRSGISASLEWLGKKKAEN